MLTSKSQIIYNVGSLSLEVKKCGILLQPVGEIDAIVEGEEAKIAFNGKYLIDVLGVLRETQVVLETTNPSSPGVIRPVGVDN